MGERERTHWEVLREELLEPLARELRPLAAGMEGPDEAHARQYSFEELTERTKCAEFPGGLDFSSDPGSVKRFLYEKRVEIADEFLLYYTGVYGYGIKFTANPLLGLKWREEYELEQAFSKAGTTERLWSLAKSQVPQRLRATCNWFLRRAKERRDRMEQIKREGDAKYLRLEKGEAKADE